MSLTHIIDGTVQPVTVVTTGSDGAQIARTTWPDMPSALSFAERMSAMVGGPIVEVVS